MGRKRDEVGEGLDPAYLAEVYRIDEAGALWFRERPFKHFKSERVWRIFNAQNAGKKVSVIEMRGTLDGRSIDLRRVLIALETGEWPTGRMGGMPRRDYGAGKNRPAEQGGMPSSFGGALRRVLEEACEEENVTRDEMTVLSVENDPFRLDIPSRHRDGSWFAEMMASVSAEALTIHLRGLHYQLVARGNVEKPNGEVYLNTLEDWEWLVDDASKAARWLGYVPFERIRDNRAGEPIIKRRAYRLPEASVRSGLTAALDHGDTLEPVGTEDAALALPVPKLSNFEPRQRYAFAVFGEKSSLLDEIDPVAERLNADLYGDGRAVDHAHP
jgi:hypothetical protein